MHRPYRSGFLEHEGEENEADDGYAQGDEHLPSIALATVILVLSLRRLAVVLIRQIAAVLALLRLGLFGLLAANPLVFQPLSTLGKRALVLILIGHVRFLCCLRSYSRRWCNAAVLHQMMSSTHNTTSTTM